MAIMEYFKGGSFNLDELPPKKHCTLWVQSGDYKLKADSGYEYNQMVHDLVYDFDSLAEKGLEVGLSFMPQLHNRFTPNTLTQIVMNILDEFNQRLRKSSDIKYIFIGEFSPVGRFHFHGTISGLTPYQLNKFNRLIRDRLGAPDIKQIHHVPNYVTYATKQFIYRDRVLNKYKDFVNSKFDKREEEHDTIPHHMEWAHLLPFIIYSDTMLVLKN